MPGQVIGYVRIFSVDQNPDRGLARLTAGEPVQGTVLLRHLANQPTAPLCFAFSARLAVLVHARRRLGVSREVVEVLPVPHRAVVVTHEVVEEEVVDVPAEVPEQAEEVCVPTERS
jgi:hypothetical protein